jgi:protein TonB
MSVAVRLSRRPLVIAALIALALHLFVALALSAALDWQPPVVADLGKTAAVPALFELLPSPEVVAEAELDAAAAEFVAPPQFALPQGAEPVPEPEPEPDPDSEPDPDPDPAPAPALADALEPASDMTGEPDAPVVVSDPIRAADLPPPVRQVSAADILASRGQALASLQPRSLASDAAGKKRRKTINASTQEYVYANYLESWRRKVERIGNLNYPEEAKEKRLFGSLLLHAAVRADGSLESVRVLRSSGHAVLDQAAVRIVELSAPFAPFPENIRANHDVLDIVRTWQFLREQKLGWDK